MMDSLHQKDVGRRRERTDLCRKLGDNMQITVDYNQIKHMARVLLKKYSKVLHHPHQKHHLGSGDGC